MFARGVREFAGAEDEAIHELPGTRGGRHGPILARHPPGGPPSGLLPGVRRVLGPRRTDGFGAVRARPQADRRTGGRASLKAAGWGRKLHR